MNESLDGADTEVSLLYWAIQYNTIIFADTRLTRKETALVAFLENLEGSENEKGLLLKGRVRLLLPKYYIRFRRQFLGEAIIF